MGEDVSFAPGDGGDLQAGGGGGEGLQRCFEVVWAMLDFDVQSLVVNELKALSGGMSVGIKQFSSLLTSDFQWG